MNPMPSAVMPKPCTPEFLLWLAEAFEACADAIDEGANGWERESYDASSLRQVEERARQIARDLHASYLQAE